MARYIDADELLEKAEEIEWFNEGTGYYDLINIVHKYDVETAPTADVVQKSEVEKQKLEIWRLQGEVERLEKEVDRLSQVVLYHDSVTEMKVCEAKEELAREIFEDFTKHKVCTNEEDYRVFAELKKKYIRKEEQNGSK